MHCPACGTETPADSLFCHRCGHSLQADGKSAAVGQIAARAAAAAAAATTPPQTLWEGSFAAKSMAGFWALAACFTVVAIVVAMVAPGQPGPKWGIALVLALGVWLYGFARLVYQRMSVKYKLTTQTFIHQFGVLNRVTDRIDVIDMEDISYSQTLLDRFLGVGTLQVISTDQNEPKLVLRGVPEVEKVAAIFDQARRAERMRRGIHIETS